MHDYEYFQARQNVFLHPQLILFLRWDKQLMSPLCVCLSVSLFLSLCVWLCVCVCIYSGMCAVCVCVVLIFRSCSQGTCTKEECYQQSIKPIASTEPTEPQCRIGLPSSSQEFCSSGWAWCSDGQEEARQTLPESLSTTRLDHITKWQNIIS